MNRPWPEEVDIVALTPAGAALGNRLAARMAGARLWLPARLQAAYPAAEAFTSLTSVFQRAFQTRRPLIGIMAAGIAVRQAAPWLRGKATDPAVVVMDEQGRFAVSLLSGHLGGANELARRAGELVGATPVITTASDVQGLPAVDLLAARLGLEIENLEAVKVIQMAWLRGEKVRLVDPGGICREALAGWEGLVEEEAEEPGVFQRPGPAMYVGCRIGPGMEGWLRLRPRVLVAGVGCNRGTVAAEILALLEDTLARFQLSPRSLRCLATIAAKQGEPGLRDAAETLGVDLVWYSAEELQEIAVPNPSVTVQRHMGVPSVCEAAALKAAGGGRLVVPKHKSANATLAIAQVG